MHCDGAHRTSRQDAARPALERPAITPAAQHQQQWPISRNAMSINTQLLSALNNPPAAHKQRRQLVQHQRSPKLPTVRSWPCTSPTTAVLPERSLPLRESHQLSKLRMLAHSALWGPKGDCSCTRGPSAQAHIKQQQRVPPVHRLLHQLLLAAESAT